MFEPEPEPEPVFQPQPEPEPVFAPEPEPQPEPEAQEIAAETPSAAEHTPPAREHEPSYTELALAAAAAAAAAAAQTTAAPAEEAPVDDLTRIRLIDYFIRQRLKHLGVRTFEDIAGWTTSDVARVSQTLGFYGRIEQENWIEQAKILVKGGSVETAPERAPENIAAAVAVPLAADRLHRIIGIDPVTEELLVANGVTGIADIAAWTWEDVEKAEALIGKPGRVGLENWIEQARFLTRGGAPLASEPREHAPLAFVPEPEPLAPAPEPEPIPEPEPPAPEPEAEAAPAAPAIEPEPIADPELEPEAAQTEVAPAPALEPEPEVTEPEEGSPETRSDSLAGLRSVRSEALRGDADYYVAGEIDDLKRIRGVGVLIEKKLNSLGITSFEQVANWTSADIARISQVLDFKGRIERENWVEQARILASGGQTEFSRRADRGEV
jgi:predicted flap endonuclease-1-like 5' DNA nuclease